MGGEWGGDLVRDHFVGGRHDGGTLEGRSELDVFLRRHAVDRHLTGVRTELSYSPGHLGLEVQKVFSGYIKITN